jgi:hypothetical protein
VDSQPPSGPEGGEPFPTFDPSFPESERPRRPQRPASSEPMTGRPATPRRRPPTTQANPLLVGIAIGFVLATVSVIAFFWLTGGDNEAAPTTTTATTTGGSTTVTDGSNTTTSEGSTTSSTDGTNTTVTVPDTLAVTIVPVGDPIPIADLTMSSNDIGPLNFGDNGDQVLGQLAATFGQPTDDTGFIVGNGSFGECPGDSIRVVRWGPLNIVVKGEQGNSTFVSYRLDLKYGGITSPTTDIATKSGLRVGDTVGALVSIYQNYVIEYVVNQDVGLTFELRASQADDLPLIWGPIESQAEDALVTGIYSPDSCDQTTTTTTG